VSTKNNVIARGHGRVHSDGRTAAAGAVHPNSQIVMKVMEIQGCAAQCRPISLMYWRTVE
jgi:hypothetical protein